MRGRRAPFTTHHRRSDRRGRHVVSQRSNRGESRMTHYPFWTCLRTSPSVASTGPSAPPSSRNAPSSPIWMTAASTPMSRSARAVSSAEATSVTSIPVSTVVSVSFAPADDEHARCHFRNLPAQRKTRRDIPRPAFVKMSSNSSPSVQTPCPAKDFVGHVPKRVYRSVFMQT